MIDNKILISVIMPVYNSAKFLSEAIDSILNQTLDSFELIIIDDASTDCSLEIIKKYNDHRIVIIENNINHGIVYSLNYGISISKGKYIARMDSDDISDSKRFEIQLKYLLENNLDVCGSFIQFFGSTNYTKIFPTKYEDIIFLMQFGSPIAHPTAFFKKSFFDSIKYKEDFKYVEDLEIWKSAIINGKKIGNVPTILLFYRTHINQSSNVSKLIQLDKSYLISLELSNNIFKQKYINQFSNYKFGYFISINDLDSYSFIKKFLFESRKLNINIELISHYYTSILLRTHFNNIFKLYKFFKLSKYYNLKMNRFLYFYIIFINTIPVKIAEVLISFSKSHYHKISKKH